MSFTRAEGRVTLRDESPCRYSLEEYATAVRAYQEIVLQLQEASLHRPDVVSGVLKRAAEAKQAVNCYRSAYLNGSQGPELGTEGAIFRGGPGTR